MKKGISLPWKLSVKAKDSKLDLSKYLLLKALSFGQDVLWLHGLGVKRLSRKQKIEGSIPSEAYLIGGLVLLSTVWCLLSFFIRMSLKQTCCLRIEMSSK